MQPIAVRLKSQLRMLKADEVAENSADQELAAPVDTSSEELVEPVVDTDTWLVKYRNCLC